MTSNAIQLHWYNGNCEGYTDDLGIIADRNQWIEARPAGWYLYSSPRWNYEMLKWCRANLESYEEYRGDLSMSSESVDRVILDEEDVILFRMRWG